MEMLENSDAIVSDDDSLKLDCRIIVPKFKKEEYDTFQTETYTSVVARVKQIRSNSQEFRFLQSNQVSPLCSLNFTYKKLIQCTQLNLDDESNISKEVSHFLPVQRQRNVRKSIRKDNILQSPSGSVEHIGNSQTPINQEYNSIRMRTQIIQPLQKQSLIRQGKRQLTQTYKSCALEVSPIKITRFSQRQIYVTQLVNTNQEPLQEKLSLVQLENKEKLCKLPLRLFRSKTNTVKFTKQNTQPKSILKSKLCLSEDGRRRKSFLQESQNVIKKVSFHQIKIPYSVSLRNKKEALYQQQYIRIQ
ncbi:unnamed protein product (macronuclear) [Paramecium tetraurelia]|uniref:TPX2 central domain-containing protein n=1 Tax=Paramecium tetraurelia TaxID=5888 RepID=A0DH84_PARTE|nr:uncharacterized protein GSPATT00016787001 [Paramecium tetraurelia]CAK82401.1 unnamed protein product [Paramecium tetraurelia]|eukprot:XP_001449798.1 hypothetical protein (macronuclear) [Paramecium tetraurelia strain d4-2]